MTESPETPDTTEEGGEATPVEAEPEAPSADTLAESGAESGVKHGTEYNAPSEDAEGEE